MTYSTVKYIHLTCVVLSFSLFFIRGLATLNNWPLTQQRWIKIAPHLVDTVLLVSAITLVYLIDVSPFSTPWLLAKIIALLIYIVLGTIALKRGKTQAIKLFAWLAALASFGYIVSTALTHNPQPWQLLG
jgi:uncharacterized membrane protein SirB2